MVLEQEGGGGEESEGEMRREWQWGGQATAKILCPYVLPLLLSLWTTCQCSTPRLLTNDVNLSWIISSLSLSLYQVMQTCNYSPISKIPPLTPDPLSLPAPCPEKLSDWNSHYPMLSGFWLSLPMGIWLPDLTTTTIKYRTPSWNFR